MFRVAWRVVLALLALFLFSCDSSSKQKSDEDALSVVEEDAIASDEDMLLADEESEESGGDADAFVPDVETIPGDFAGESGFITIELVTYYLRTKPGTTGTKYVSDEARLWYAFVPAEEKMEEKPIAVFYNGGPGSATGLLLAFNTGRRSMDEKFNGGLPVGENPAAWTRFANVLYIDARTTGFSYSIIGTQKGFSTRNFNPFLDGADFVRVILRFLAAHPAIRGNPVIFAGESYGGTRTIVIQNLLLNPERYAGKNGYYTDEALAAEIAAHYAAVFPEEEVTPAKRAKQFGYAALIQPLLFGEAQNIASGELLEQPGSVVYQIAAEEGATFTPCDPNDTGCDKYYNAILFVNGLGRDLYKYDEEDGWMNGLMTPIVPRLLTRTNYVSLIGHDPVLIAPMYAKERENAYKIASPVTALSSFPAVFEEPLSPRALREIWLLRLLFAPSEDDPEEEFRALFGTLGDYDTYYASLNEKVTEAFYRHTIHPFNNLFGDLFLENLLVTETFITQASLDLVIFSPAIPEAAKYFPQVAGVEVGAESFTISYVPGSFEGVGEGVTRTVVWPRYEKSGHSVTVTEPDKYASDVEAWYKSLGR